MINLIIYLQNKQDAETLVHYLIKNSWVAHASIDVDNRSYFLKDNEVAIQSLHVVTAQTKSLLFSKITNHIEEKFGAHIPVYSLPITQTNNEFYQLMQMSTIS